MHVIEVMAMMKEVMDYVLVRSCNAGDRRDGDGDGHCYRIEAVIHVIDVMVMVMEVIDIILGSKLYYMR